MTARNMHFLFVALTILSFGVLHNSCFGQPGPIERDARDCTDCDHWFFPFRLDCQWVEHGTAVDGQYYELATSFWDNNSACHSPEQSLPFSKTFTYSIPEGTKPLYILEPSSVEVGMSANFYVLSFGLSAGWSNAGTPNILSDSMTDSCNSAGCCLPTGYAHKVYNYTQKFYKRQVWSGTPSNGHWSDCASGQTTTVLKTLTSPLVTGTNKNGKYVPVLQPETI